MTQKIGQQRDIIELQKEILCVQMPEGVGVDGGGVDAVLLGEFLQLAVDPPGVICWPRRFRKMKPEVTCFSESHFRPSSHKVSGK